MLRKGHGGLHQAPAMEENMERLRGEGDQTMLIDLRFERLQTGGSIFLGRHHPEPQLCEVGWQVLSSPHFTSNTKLGTHYC